MTIFIVIIVVLVIAFLVLGSTQSQAEKEVNLKMNTIGMQKEDLFSTGSYIGGHPDKDQAIAFCYGLQDYNNIIFYDWTNKGEIPQKQFVIPVDAIKNVTIEDLSTIENRVALGRILLVGVFALAWKKKDKKEISFLIIDWNDGKFDHNTTFTFEGEKALENSNICRNKIIKISR